MLLVSRPSLSLWQLGQWTGGLGGALVLKDGQRDVGDFTAHYRLLQPETNARNPWFANYWRQVSSGMPYSYYIVSSCSIIIITTWNIIHVLYCNYDKVLFCVVGVWMCWVRMSSFLRPTACSAVHISTINPTCHSSCVFLWGGPHSAPRPPLSTV